MKPFDFNVHLPCNRRNLIKSELTASAEGLVKVFIKCIAELKKNSCSANFMLFNQNVLLEKKTADLIHMACENLPGSCFTVLADFRSKDTPGLIGNIGNSRIRGIKFHSYVQRITRSDYPKVLELCRIAQEQNKFIAIDTSFGTSKMYDYDNLELACFICDHIQRAPIILLHSGGARVKEALLLALDKANVFLETSFSVNYFLGSSVEIDLAFAFKKIGAKRVIYGSDFPYVSFKDSLNTTTYLLKKYKFNNLEIADIMRNNAIVLSGKC